LIKSARDLATPGRDTIYGYGFVELTKEDFAA